MNALRQQQAKLEGQARQALDTGREDLAQEAFAQKTAIESQLSDLAAQCHSLQADEEKVTTDYERLAAKVEAFQVQRETIQGTDTAGEAQSKVGEAASDISEKTGGADMAKGVDAPKSGRSKRPVSAKPWYARVSTWVAGAIAGPVIVAAILKLTGLNDSPTPAPSPAILFISPFHIKSGVLKVNVTPEGINDNLTLVFPTPYSFNASQKALTGNPDYFYRLNRNLIASGGANLHSMLITVTITNTSALTAEIVGARIVDRLWYKPWTGTLLYLPPQGAVFPSGMGFNLDRIVPVAENLNKLKMEGLFFNDHDIQLPPGVPTTINVLATTALHAVSFRLAIDYIIDGQALTLVIGRGPKPFYVSAMDCTDPHKSPYQLIYSLNLRKGRIQPMNSRELQANQGVTPSTLCVSS